MESTKQLAIELFNLRSPSPCKCGGNHEICLHCKRCRTKQEDQTATDFENLGQYIDHTILKPETTYREVNKVCAEAEEFGFCSVCVNPSYVELCGYQLTDPKVCCVVGFPLGASEQEIKLAEAVQAIQKGAKEIDVVINIGFFKSKRYNVVSQEIEELSSYCHKRKVKLKVILETCLLNHIEIAIACLICKKSGADFVKTSTGFNKAGATEEDVRLMRNVVGSKMGVKASGGIRTREQAIGMLKAGANRLGTSASLEIVKGE